MAKRKTAEKVVDTETKVEDNVIDLDLSVTAKKRFRIDGDNKRVLELNTSDLGVVARLSDAYPKLDKLMEKVAEVGTDIDVDENADGDPELEAMGKKFSEIDTEMRNLLDYIFDANVSDVCAPSGSMYDPFEGQFRYEHIITLLSGLYETNLTSEMKKVSQKVKKHTDKYVGR